MSADSAQFIAIDIGTGSARAAVVDSSGRVLGLASRSYEQQIPQPGWSEQNPEEWWSGVTESLLELTASTKLDCKRLTGVAVCGQMHGPVPLDAEGRVLLDRVQLWNDKRPAKLVETFQQQSRFSSLSRVLANPSAPSWVAFKVRWIRENQPAFTSALGNFSSPRISSTTS